VKLALDELRFFTREMKILGIYPAHSFRLAVNQAEVD
jgi:prephenate dehydratase